MNIQVTRTGRRIAAAVSATTLTAAALALDATPAAAEGSGTVNTPGSTLTVRTGPSTDHTAVDQLADGTPITIECTASNGEAVAGPYGTSTVWDRLDDDRWVADA